MGEGGSCAGSEYKYIYDTVKSTGIPNCMGTRIPLESGINILAWEKYIDNNSDEAQLLQLIKYVFSQGYLGPCSDTTDTPNHGSVVDFPHQVSAFVDNEVGMGAPVGPFSAPPLTPWAHVSPLMSRPKSDGVNRRIISDLTFPKEHSVNAYIQKNGTLGDVRDH